MYAAKYINYLYFFDISVVFKSEQLWYYFGFWSKARLSFNVSEGSSLEPPVCILAVYIRVFLALLLF